MSSSIYVLLLFQVLGLFNGKLIAESTELPRKEWWEITLVYQILPRSFQDSDGDGVGDLKGIISRLDYIEELGVETIWLNPIYSSPLLDSGYDISNHTDVHPIFGTLEDFDKLLNESHNRGLKVILDFVPNHSSDQHEWFQLSVKNEEPYKDFYVWANGTTDDNGQRYPPNNWVSTYSDEDGSAWTWNDDKKQWYYHKFHTSQPDLNLRNEKVIEELKNVLDFWLKRGIDGFRISAVPYFFEDEQLRNRTDNETRTFDLHENTELLYMFRAYVTEWVKENNATPKLLIAESDSSSHNLIEYYKNSTHEGIPPFNFHFIKHVHNSSDAEYIKNVLMRWLDLIPENYSTNWVLSNHDNSRATSRIGLNRIDGLHMLTLLLPGQAYTYYGEEIAMLDTKLTWNETIDPMGRNRTEETYEKFSRDPARTPMQWNSSVSAGFSTNEKPYLPVHPDFTSRNVEIQQSQNRSNLKTYKMLAILRREAVFVHGDYEFETLNNNRIFVIKRFLEDAPIYIIIINLGLHEEKVNLTSLYPDLSNTLEVVIASSNAIHVKDIVPTDNIILTANAALVLRTRVEEGHTTDIIGTTDYPRTTDIPGEATTINYITTEETTTAATTTTIVPMTTKETTTARITTTTVPSVTTITSTPTVTTTSATLTTFKPKTTESTTTRKTTTPMFTPTKPVITTMPKVNTTTVAPTTPKSENGNSAVTEMPLSALIVSTTFAVIVLFGKFS